MVKKVLINKQKKFIGDKIMLKQIINKILMLSAIILVFNIAANAQLTLKTPENNSRCLNWNPTFSWTFISNVQKYEVYLSTDIDFADPVTWKQNVGKDTVKQFIQIFPDKALATSTKYYWKVVATLENTQVVTSSTFNFTTYTQSPYPVYPYSFLCCLDTLVDFEIGTSNVAKIDSLRILIGYNRAFTNIALDTIIANVSVTDAIAKVRIKLPKYETTYYWTAMQNINGCWADSLPDHTQSFCTKANATTLLEPANDAKGIPLFQDGRPFNVNLKWQKINQALAYVVTIADNPNFTNSKSYWVADTFATITLPDDYNQIYYWRVVGKTPPITMVDQDVYDTCQTVVSTTWKFKTPFGPINLVYPNDNDKCVPMIYTTSWDGDGVAGSYRLQIATSPTFDQESMVLDRNNITTTSQIIQLPQGLTKYYWRVRAENVNNIGLWSVVRSFESTAETPKDIYPTTGSTGVPRSITIKWAPGKPGTAFQLQIFTDSDLENKILDTLLNTNEFAYTFAKYNTKYYWRVKGYFDNCQSIWSPTYTLKTYIEPPYNLDPKDKATGIDPFLITFTWDAVAETQQYDLDLSTDSTFKNYFRFERNITAKKVIYGTFAENTTYYWRVRGKNSEGTSEWTKIHTFKTGYLKPELPKLSTPSNGFRKQPIKLNLCWEQAERALRYHLQVSKTSDFKQLLVDVDTITTVCYELDNLENGTTYYWKVAAINLGGTSGFTPAWNFTTIPLPPTEKVNLVSPANNATNVLTFVDLKWDAINNVDSYELVMAKDPEFKDIYYSNDKVWSNTRRMQNLPPLTKLYWKVRGVNEGGVSPWSDVWNFTTEDPKSITEFTQELGQIYPNPASDILILNLKPEINIQLIEIRSIEGKSIQNLNIKPENTQKIDISNLTGGSYLLMIQSTNNTYIYKFVVNR